MNAGRLLLRHLNIDPHPVNVSDLEQLLPTTATGVDEVADIGFARGHDAVEGRNDLLEAFERLQPRQIALIGLHLSLRRVQLCGGVAVVGLFRLLLLLGDDALGRVLPPLVGRLRELPLGLPRLDEGFRRTQFAFCRRQLRIEIRSVDFGAGATSFDARVASNGSGGSIELHLDSLTGTVIGTCAVSGTGGAQTWTTKSCTVTSTTGVHDLFLKFTGSGSNLFNFNWWRFGGPGATSTDGGTGGTGTGGTPGSGGTTGSGGKGGGGGAAATGTGGSASGGVSGTGGRGASAGGSGGTTVSGAGGAAGSTSAGSGGVTGSGGSAASGGTTGSGGAVASGGVSGTGGTGGPGMTGSSGGSGVNDGGGTSGCSCESSPGRGDGAFGIFALLAAAICLRRREDRSRR